MTTKVLTQEEIQLLKSIQEKRLQLTEQFGLIELRIQEYELQKEYLKEELKKITSRRNQNRRNFTTKVR